MRRAITADAETAIIRELHIKGGGKSLRDEGVMVALSGKTSLEEVLRVTRGEDDTAIEPVPAAAPPAGADPTDPTTGRAAA